MELGGDNNVPSGCDSLVIRLKPGPHRTRTLLATVRARPSPFRSVPSKPPRSATGGGFDGTDRAGTAQTGAVRTGLKKLAYDPPTKSRVRLLNGPPSAFDTPTNRLQPACGQREISGRSAYTLSAIRLQSVIWPRPQSITGLPAASDLTSARLCGPVYMSIKIRKFRTDKFDT